MDAHFFSDFFVLFAGREGELWLGLRAGALINLRAYAPCGLTPAAIMCRRFAARTIGDFPFCGLAPAAIVCRRFAAGVGRFAARIERFAAGVECVFRWPCGLAPQSAGLRPQLLHVAASRLNGIGRVLHLRAYAPCGLTPSAG